MKAIVIIAALLLVLFSAFAHAQVENQTFRDSSGRTLGYSSSNGPNTTYRNALGQNTGRSVTSNNGTTTFYNSKGQQTGTVRGRK